MFNLVHRFCRKRTKSGTQKKVLTILRGSGRRREICLRIWKTLVSCCINDDVKQLAEMTWQSLPPATKLEQGYVFTRVCDSVHGGDLPQCMLGYHPPGAPPAGSRPTNPPPPGAGIPLGADPPGAVHAGGYGQQAGGRHSTGMQSC